MSRPQNNLSLLKNDFKFNKAKPERKNYTITRKSFFSSRKEKKNKKEMVSSSNRRRFKLKKTKMHLWEADLEW